MKRGRFYRILAVAILLPLLQVIIPATPVLAAPILSISPTSGAVGTTVTVTGDNFDSYSGDDIYLFFDDQKITGNPLTVPQVGSFSFDLDIPASARPGQHQIRAESELGSTLASGSFTVLKAYISLDSKAGGVDTTLTINGQGFYADRVISFYYDGELLGSESADDTGEFSYSFAIPEGTAGMHKIAARNLEGHSAEAEFEVLPSITLNKTSATTGSILSVSGNGFNPASSIDISFKQDEVAYAKSNEIGSFQDTLFNVPEMAPGTYDVIAIDKEGANGGSMFTIIAEVSAEDTTEDTSTNIPEEKPDEPASSNWGIFILIGIGVLVIVIFIFWLGRRTAYQ